MASTQSVWEINFITYASIYNNFTIFFVVNMVLSILFKMKIIHFLDLNIFPPSKKKKIWIFQIERFFYTEYYNSYTLKYRYFNLGSFPYRSNLFWFLLFTFGHWLKNLGENKRLMSICVGKWAWFSTENFSGSIEPLRPN